MLEVCVQTRLRAFTLDVSLRVGCEGLALAGPSGAGKTTVLKAVAGLIRPQAGRIACGCRVWFDSATDVWTPPEERRLGYVFQDYALFPHLSALDNVCYGLLGLSRSKRRRHAQQLLDKFGVGTLSDCRPSELSGGERQRVAVARALAREPHALLLDEPLSALDASTRPVAARELRAILSAAQVPTLVVTHDFLEAASLADSIAVIDEGRVVQTGTAAQLAASPASAFVADFSGANLIRGNARPASDGLTEVALDGGGVVVSTEAGQGRVGVAVFPWDLTLDIDAPGPQTSSHLNQLAATVSSVTVIGNRARIVLSTPQSLVCELTTQSTERLNLEAGTAVTCVWKATATRLVRLDR
jgi:molybdate transport system ATP-binding protein